MFGHRIRTALVSEFVCVASVCIVQAHSYSLDTYTGYAVYKNVFIWNWIGQCGNLFVVQLSIQWTCCSSWKRTVHSNVLFYLFYFVTMQLSTHSIALNNFMHPFDRNVVLRQTNPEILNVRVCVFLWLSVRFAHIHHILQPFDLVFFLASVFCNVIDHSGELLILCDSLFAHVRQSNANKMCWNRIQYQLPYNEQFGWF